MSLVEIKVPDIGDFADVEVIEILVKVGDSVAKEQSLITVESDKASMEIPCSDAGIVKAINVKLGDKINQGDLVLQLETSATASQTEVKETAPSKAVAQSTAPVATSTPAPVNTPQPATQASSNFANIDLASLGESDIQVDLVVLGGGPGGYSAAFRAADLGLSVAIVERYSTLGGVCLNVGCIPSKALLHVAGVMEEVKHFSQLGVSYNEPKIDIDALRNHKQQVIAKLTGGLAAMAKMRKVNYVRGIGKFIDAHRLEVQQTSGTSKQTTGEKTIIAFKTAIIAAGSEAIALPFLPKDERIVNSTGALALPKVPKRMLIIGGGIIGLEMATVYSQLGASVDVVEASTGLMAGADKDLTKVWEKINKPKLNNLMLETKTVAATASEQGILVTFEGKNAPEQAQLYDLVLEAVGRKPNGLAIGAENTGVAVTERGFINVDKQMRTSVAHIFAIGDIVGQPMLAHKAVHEAHVAAQVIAGELTGDNKLAKTTFDARIIPSVAYTDPEVAWVGVTEEQAKAENIAITKGLFPWSASGRAIANGRDEGLTKLIFDAKTDRIIGGAIVGTNAGDMIGEIALAIEMCADSVDIAKTIHPHPTLGESIGLAAEAAHGHCTDLPPVKKK